MADERFDVEAGDFVLERGGLPVGVLSVDAASQQEAARALTAAGFALVPAESTGASEVVYAIGGDCTPAEPRPCELEAALVMVEVLGDEAGVSTAEVVAISERQSATEAQVKAACAAVVDRLPADMQPQGRAAMQEAGLA